MAGESIEVDAAPAGPVPINARTQETPNLTESDLRAVAIEAEQTGNLDVVLPNKAQTSTPTQAQPATLQPVTQEVPPKFIAKDGTVDEEKIQTSTRQLEEAIQEKQLTIEEMIAQYREKEREFRNLPKDPEQVARVAQERLAQMPAEPVPAAPPVPNDALLQQIQADFQRDPVGTIIDIVKAVNERQLKPVNEFLGTIKDQQREQYTRNSLAELAKNDSRVSNPEVYNEILKEIKSDPNYLNLKNPLKAAWNEVKARLRLGDVQTPAQPGKTASPILGGGTPPPVPSTTSMNNPRDLGQAINLAKTKDEMTAVEEALRSIVVNAGM